MFGRTSTIDHRTSTVDHRTSTVGHRTTTRPIFKGVDQSEAAHYIIMSAHIIILPSLPQGGGVAKPPQGGVAKQLHRGWRSPPSPLEGWTPWGPPPWGPPWGVPRRGSTVWRPFFFVVFFVFLLFFSLIFYPLGDTKFYPSGGRDSPPKLISINFIPPELISDN